MILVSDERRPSICSHLFPADTYSLLSRLYVPTHSYEPESLPRMHFVRNTDQTRTQFCSSPSQKQFIQTLINHTGATHRIKVLLSWRMQCKPDLTEPDSVFQAWDFHVLCCTQSVGKTVKALIWNLCTWSTENTTSMLVKCQIVVDGIFLCVCVTLLIV